MYLQDDALSIRVIQWNQYLEPFLQAEGGEIVHLDFSCIVRRLYDKDLYIESLPPELDGSLFLLREDELSCLSYD